MRNMKILFTIKSNKGMGLLQFMLVLFLAFVVIAMFVEIGAILRSEALVVNSAVKLAKTLQSDGRLTASDINNETTKLNNAGIINFDVRITPRPPLTFRENFTLVARAKYQTRLGGFLAGINGISFPIGITIKGKSEYFSP